MVHYILYSLWTTCVSAAGFKTFGKNIWIIKNPESHSVLSVDIKIYTCVTKSNLFYNAVSIDLIRETTTRIQSVIPTLRSHSTTCLSHLIASARCQRKLMGDKVTLQPKLRFVRAAVTICKYVLTSQKTNVSFQYIWDILTNCII